MRVRVNLSVCLRASILWQINRYNALRQKVNECMDGKLINCSDKRATLLSQLGSTVVEKYILHSLCTVIIKLTNGVIRFPNVYDWVLIVLCHIEI